MSKMSDEQIEKAMKSAKANLELEGFEVTEEHTELVKKSLTGEISEEEFLKKALEAAKKKK